jgi:hypothetical protein
MRKKSGLTAVTSHFILAKHLNALNNRGPTGITSERRLTAIPWFLQAFQKRLTCWTWKETWFTNG